MTVRVYLQDDRTGERKISTVRGVHGRRGARAFCAIAYPSYRITSTRLVAA